MVHIIQLKFMRKLRQQRLISLPELTNFADQMTTSRELMCKINCILQTSNNLKCYQPRRLAG